MGEAQMYDRLNLGWARVRSLGALLSNLICPRVKSPNVWSTLCGTNRRNPPSPVTTTTTTATTITNLAAKEKKIQVAIAINPTLTKDPTTSSP